VRKKNCVRLFIMKILFFVNGSEASAAGIRAKTLAEKLPMEWDIRFNYRPSPKWKGIFPFIQSALHFQPHIIYVMDTAYTGVISGYVAKKLLGCQLVTDTGDVAFELAKSVGTYSQNQLMLIRWVEQLTTKHSNFLVVRGSYHKQLLESQGIRNVEFIPDGVDFQSLDSIEPGSLKQELGLGDSLVVGVVGTMSWSDRHQMCYGWDIVEALVFLKDVPVKALLVGDGNGRAILEQRAKELGVADRIVFAGQLPYDQLPQYISAMDVCISTQSNDLVGMVRTTGKLPLYLAYGRYVIATDVGEARRVLPGIGCLLPYEGVRDDHHPARLAAHLRLLLAEPERMQVSKTAIQIAEKNFDYKILAQRVQKICEQLMHIPTELEDIEDSRDIDHQP
jgi:glycosyltransferase involved in cell wall biosynthesis